MTSLTIFVCFNLNLFYFFRPHKRHNHSSQRSMSSEMICIWRRC